MLPPDQRLRANKDFRLVYSRAKSCVGPLAVIYTWRTGRSEGGAIRIGIVVSKKQGCSVVRNRIKRRMREAVRAQIKTLQTESIDVVLIGRKGMLSAEWPEVMDAVATLFRRSGLAGTESAHLPQPTDPK